MKNHTICWNNVSTVHKNRGVESIQPVQMSIYRSNTYKKDSDRLHFDEEASAQEKEQG